MPVISLKRKEEFDNVIKQVNLVAVHFYADWVDQCQTMEKVFAEMSSQKDYKEVKFAKIPAEDAPEVSLKYNVSAVPTFILFKDGTEAYRVEGANPGVLSSKMKLLAELKTSKLTRSPSPEVRTEGDLNTRLQRLINSAPIILFMKGNTKEPRCGFSSEIVKILTTLGVKFSTFDILQDNEVREGLKKYSNWPTYPQLYVNGELIGGLDIVREMVKSGELQGKLPKEDTLTERLKKLVNKGAVMLFMKGDRDNPRCGFSRQMIELLRQADVNYETFDILSDDEVRQGLKAFSNWPTYPQLYHNGELIGGLDIAKELHASGELKKMLSS